MLGILFLRKLSFLLLASLAGFLAISCRNSDISESEALSQRPLGRTQRSVEDIIGSIKAFSKVATERAASNSATIPASRLRMADFISELKEASPKKPFEEELRLSQGSWRQIWSDDQNPIPPGQKIIKSKVYQVIRSDGFGFNFGIRAITLPNGAEIIATSAIQLHLEAERQLGLLKVTFLKTFSKQGDLSEEPSLAELAQGLLDGTRVNDNANGFKQDEERRFPRGPVGAVGTLETIYIDETFRIAQGPNPYSKVVDTFILVKSDVPQ